MCDYSLDLVASRPAKVGDELVTRMFENSMTRGFAAIGAPDVAVCLLPGTEVAFEQDVRYERFFAFLPHIKLGTKVARFRQINVGKPRCTTMRWSSPTGRPCCSPACAEASTRPCCSCRLLRSP